MSGSAPRDRFQQLDALRAVAITVVMLHHFIDPPILLSGFGVTFLFVLSGYFSTNTLLKLRRQMEEGRMALGGAAREFYFRRYLRICPTYFLVLGLTALCNVDGARDGLPWNAFFLSNIQTLVTGQWNGRFAPLWSLSFLEQFYMVLPFMILWLPRKRLPLALMLLTSLGIIWRFICLRQNLSGIAWVVSPFASCDAVGLGALLGVARLGLADQTLLRRLIWTARWIGVPAYLLLFTFKAIHYAPWYEEVLIPFAASLAFVWLSEKASRGFKGPVGRLLDNESFGRIGQMSYSIFLIHDFTELLLPHAGILGRILDSNYRSLILIPLTIVLANMSWRWIERPIMEMRRRLPRPTLPILRSEPASVVEPS
ncbi:MAG TPA: acyltransferase [Chthoniobacteraceae bacterium]|jgi:peptidoglycan/LPS O-acetylase OafA/YrhL|nr:acyltransferase [Chthoniobacteraceae bacterium]